MGGGELLLKYFINFKEERAARKLKYPSRKVLRRQFPLHHTIAGRNIKRQWQNFEENSQTTMTELWREFLPRKEKWLRQAVVNIDDEIIVGDGIDIWPWKLSVYQNPLHKKHKKEEREIFFRSTKRKSR